MLGLLHSCLPEQKIATTFIQSPGLINLQVNPPGMVFKFNHKGELIDGFDSLPAAQQDSALWFSSKYMQFINDSVLLENYMNSFIKELRVLGFRVFLNGAVDSLFMESNQSYRLDISQIQLDEYLYPLEEEDAFLDTIYYKTFNLNAVDYSCWFDLSKAGVENGRKTLLYSSNTAYDAFDGRFYNDPFTGTVRYRFTNDTLQIHDVYEMSSYLGKKHAGYLYDFFLNQYIAKNLPKGIEMMDYYHYSLKRKNIMPAYDDKFEILRAK